MGCESECEMKYSLILDICQGKLLTFGIEFWQ